MKEITVTTEHHQTRLDKFLTEYLPDLSRSQIQKMIKNKQVLVNGKEITPHHFLKTDNVVSFRPKVAVSDRSGEIPQTNSRDSSTPSRKLRDSARNDIQIIHEDENILVINKPAGLLTHPRSEKLIKQEPTVSAWLTKKYPKTKKVGDKPELRPGIVHRLDKEASGIMVLAKTQKAYDHLKEQFHNHTVKKEYLVLTYGKVAAETGRIEFAIGRAKDKGMMAARPLGEEGKTAETNFDIIKRFPNCTLLRATPKTGRTHQIRVHFFAFDHPLVGDPLYQMRKYVPISTGRLMLHAHKLTIKDMSGETKTFEAKIPAEFNKFL
jgi:23S rRNA pseudouridine1911/1915/1917 synthase